DLAVQLEIELVVEILVAAQCVQVARAAWTGRRGQLAEHLGREGRHLRNRYGRIRGEHFAGQRIAHGHGEDSAAIVKRWNRRERGKLLDLAESLVIGEEERAVLRDRSSQRAAELIALERRLAGGRLEKADRVEIGVADELPSAAVKVVAAAAEGRV